MGQGNGRRIDGGPRESNSSLDYEPSPSPKDPGGIGIVTVPSGGAPTPKHHPADPGNEQEQSIERTQTETSDWSNQEGRSATSYPQEETLSRSTDRYPDQYRNAQPIPPRTPQWIEEDEGPRSRSLGERQRDGKECLYRAERERERAHWRTMGQDLESVSPYTLSEFAWRLYRLFFPVCSDLTGYARFCLYYFCIVTWPLPYNLGCDGTSTTSLVRLVYACPTRHTALVILSPHHVTFVNNPFLYT